MPDISEKNFESTIECALLAGGPDACPGDETVTREPAPVYGTLIPGGFRRRTSQDYDPELCLDPEMVVAFVQATQPKEWARQRPNSKSGSCGSLRVVWYWRTASR